jgi:hypothetical protein
MTDYYGDHLQRPSLVQPAVDASRRSLTRNSYYSHNSPSVNATTRSWVHSQQNTPGSPPSLPLPIPLPTPVQRLRPLPNPHTQQHRTSILYTVNPSEPLDSEEEHQQRMDNIRFGLQKAGPSKLRKPPASIHDSVRNIKDKNQTVLGGLIKSIRRIPKIVGYGAGSKGTTSKRRGTLGTDGEGTSTSVTGITGSTLPKYTSNPPTPVVAPIPSRPHRYAHQSMGMQIPMTVPVLGSSPPEVVRLDDVRRCRPDFRIMPPSINIARSETAHFFPGTTNNTDSSSSADNTAERTTVMLYNHDHHTPTPTPPLSRQISSNGPPRRLSYVGSEQVVRPTSFHGGSQAPPPIEIPTSTTRIGTPASYLSYVSQPTTLPSTLPLHIKRSSSQLRSQLSSQSQHHQQHQLSSPPQHQPSSTPPIIESSERMQSPISAHPQPTTDYLKMALSPPHSLQHHTTALPNLTSATHHSSSGITSFSYDPSFSKTSGRIERFFKTVYHMPWIAYERITVDYLPGKVGRVHGHALSRETSSKGVRDERRRGGDRRRRETRDRNRNKGRRKQRRTRVDRGDGDKKVASWYKGVSSRSKRTSAELDLLSSDLGLHSSLTTTTGIGAAIGLGLENLPASPRSPLVATVTTPVKERERRQRERKENVGDMQGRSSQSRRHHHRQDPHNRHRGRQRRRIGSRDDDEDEGLNQSPSHLIPMVYPFHYPPYPYPYAYTFPMPSASGPHAPHAQTQTQTQTHPLSPPSETPNEQTQSRNQRGPRSKANQGHPSLSHPVFYSPGIPHPGYTAPAHAYQPMIAPSTSTMMAPQVYLLHSTSHGQLPVQPLSPSGPVQNGSGIIGEGGGGGGGRIGPEVVLDAVQQ